MSDFGEIQNIVLEYAELYAQAFRAGAPVKTGRLKNSYRASDRDWETNSNTCC